MPGWTPWRSLAKEELTQSAEEGKPVELVEQAKQEWETCGNDVARLQALMHRLQQAPIRKDYAFDEPSDLAAIQAKRGPTRHGRVMKLKVDRAGLEDKMYGAWLGRCCGCALGKPVETFMGPANGLSSRQRIRTYLQAVGASEYPLHDYFPETSPAVDKTGPLMCPPSTREKIAFMESDDDIRYTVIGQIVMEKHGQKFGTFEVAQAWMNHLPYFMVCTAETQAYRNLVSRYDLHHYSWSKEDPGIDWHWVATHENPYREWIGAQIRADSWGYAAPGMPELAADFAWRDARMSHVKNGIYGEMFVAAMIAAAFVLDDPLGIVEAGLAEIPSGSRLFGEMKWVVAVCRDAGFNAAKFDEVLDAIEKKLGHYSPVHTNNNAALVVAALLLGQHDYEKVITIAVMGGWDSDCNGATAGSIAGAMLGAGRLPAQWTGKLHDTLHAEVIGYHPVAISECARRSVSIAEKILEI